MRRSTALFIVGAMLALVAGCGGGDSDSATTTTSSRPTTETSAATTTTVPEDIAFTGVEEEATGLGQIGGIAVDSDGVAWVTDNAGSRLVELAESGPVVHFTGEQVSNDPESAMSGLAFDPDGNVLFATRKGIHRLDPATDTAELVLGALNSDLKGPLYRLAVGADGKTFVGDVGNDMIYQLDGTSLVHVAGSGVLPTANEGTGDGGPATEATFGDLREMTIDADGNIYVADDFAQRVRRFAPGGNVETIVGGGDVPLAQGTEPAPDGTAAIDLDLEAPTGLLILDDVLFVSDTNRGVVFAVDADGAYRLVLGDVADFGSLERLAGIDPAQLFGTTGDSVFRLVP